MPERASGHAARNAWLRFGDEVIVGRLCAWLVIALMVLINIQVVLSALRTGRLVDFGRVWPLIGDGITMNTLIDAQWHLMVIVSFLPMGLLLHSNAHVRVDFAYAHFSPRAKALVDALGHALLLLPFLALTIPAAWRFVVNAWVSGEGSSLGGLRDYYLIKSVVLFGLVLLAAFVMADLARKLRTVRARAA